MGERDEVSGRGGKWERGTRWVGEKEEVSGKGGKEETPNSVL